MPIRTEIEENVTNIVTFDIYHYLRPYMQGFISVLGTNYIRRLVKGLQPCHRKPKLILAVNFDVSRRFFVPNSLNKHSRRTLIPNHFR